MNFLNRLKFVHQKLNFGPCFKHLLKYKFEDCDSRKLIILGNLNKKTSF